MLCESVPHFVPGTQYEQLIDCASVYPLLDDPQDLSLWELWKLTIQSEEDSVDD